jgi:hypothetical protein
VSRVRATPNAFAIALTALVIATAPRAELLDTLEGDVRGLAPPASLAEPGAPAASFLLMSGGSHRDLRDAPGALLIFTDGGVLIAIADEDARRFAPWRRDPESGRPLRADAPDGSRCATGTDAACWRPGDEVPYSTRVAESLGATLLPPILEEPVGPSLNQSLYTMICASSIGFSTLDRSACAQSTSSPVPDTRRRSLSIWTMQSNVLAGNRTAATLATNFLTGTPIPLVPLNEDPCDRFFSNGQGGCTNIAARAPTAFFGAGAASTLNEVLTDEQEALLGCGPFYGTDCEADGIDLLNVERSVLLQSFVPFEGVDHGYFPMRFESWQYGNGLSQPGFRGGPVNIDPFHGPKGQCAGATQLGIPCTDLAGAPLAGGGYGNATGQVFQSEMAALSFNMQNLLVAFSVPSDAAVASGRIELNELDASDPFSREPNQCSFAQPQYCTNNKAFFTISGEQRNSVRAGGNGTFGRRDFVWQSGGEGVLRYQKRNVFGFSSDFAEDVTKSNWSAEATWINANQYTDNDSFTGRSESDTVNLTVSVDRPTFINFLNPNRTFFFNSQIFFQYITEYKAGFVNNGPFNMLGTFTVQTGYFQDRLLPGLTFVYDLNSNSGAMLPQISYRFTENFSATVGMSFFFGRWEYVDTAIAPLGVIGNELGHHAYQDGVENGLSVVRERDEAYVRIRYTF